MDRRSYATILLMFDVGEWRINDGGMSEIKSFITSLLELPIALWEIFLKPWLTLVLYSVIIGGVVVGAFLLNDVLGWVAVVVMSGLIYWGITKNGDSRIEGRDPFDVDRGI